MFTNDTSCLHRSFRSLALSLPASLGAASRHETRTRCTTQRSAPCRQRTPSFVCTYPVDLPNTTGTHLADNGSERLFSDPGPCTPRYQARDSRHATITYYYVHTYALLYLHANAMRSVPVERNKPQRKSRFESNIESALSEPALGTLPRRLAARQVSIGPMREGAQRGGGRFRRVIILSTCDNRSTATSGRPTDRFSGALLYSIRHVLYYVVGELHLLAYIQFYTHRPAWHIYFSSR